jgi:hypothetical protein
MSTARLLDGFAGVAALQVGQLGVVVQDQRRQLHQHTSALGRRHAAPGAVEGAARRGHRGIDVAPVAARQRGEGLAVGGVDEAI